MNATTDQKPSYEGSTERGAARRQLERKRKFYSGVVAYVLINAFLVGIWLFGDRGYFWPGWVLGGWGVAVLMEAWEVFLRRPITEQDIDEEMQRRQ